jgi:hypothetical protein
MSTDRRAGHNKSTYDQEVVQFSSVFYTSRSTTDDDHVHEPVNLFLGLILEGSSLDTC